MKLLTLLIEPFRLDAVRQQYEDAGVNGMTVSEASAVDGDHTEMYRGSAVNSGLDPLVRIEVLVMDEDVHGLISSALVAGRDEAHPCAGRIWVTPVDQVVRVRTGERGAEAV